eukprot:scaffold130223_cov63-Phaeocystis_antarctica.AAC.1
MRRKTICLPARRVRLALPRRPARQRRRHCRGGTARRGILRKAPLPPRRGRVPLKVHAAQRLPPLGPERTLPVLPPLPGHPAAQWPVRRDVAVAVCAVEGFELLEAGIPRRLQRVPHEGSGL